MLENILVLFSAAAVCMDLHRQRIDNGWIVVGYLLGIFCRIREYGLKGVGLFLIGSAVPILLFYFLFLFRMIGAGDIKLFSVIGGLIGPRAVLICMGAALGFGAVFSLAVLILCGNLFSRLRYFAEYINQLRKTKKIVPYMIRGSRMENIHFSVPILMSVLLYVGGVY